MGKRDEGPDLWNKETLPFGKEPVNSWKLRDVKEYEQRIFHQLF